MKNHQQIKLPFEDILEKLLLVSIKHNAIIRNEYSKNNYLLFITKYDDITLTSQTFNNIQKLLNKYAKIYV